MEENGGVNDINTPSPLAGEGLGEGLNTASQQIPTTESNTQPENQLSQNLPPQDLPQQFNVEAVLNLLKLVYQYAKENGKDSSELEELVKSMEQLLEEK